MKIHYFHRPEQGWTLSRATLEVFSSNEWIGNFSDNYATRLEQYVECVNCGEFVEISYQMRCCKFCRGAAHTGCLTYIQFWRICDNCLKGDL